MANLRWLGIQQGMPGRSDDSPESGAGFHGVHDLDAGKLGAEPENRIELSGGNRPTEQEALNVRASQAREKGCLLLRLHALGRHVKAEIARDRDDRRDDGLVLLVMGHAGHEGLVYLQAPDGKVLEVVQRRMAGSEVVHRDLDAEVGQLGEDPARVRHVPHGVALRNLELQGGGGQACLLDDAPHGGGEVALLKLACRDVYGHAEVRGAAGLPTAGLLAGAAEDPVAQSSDEADFLGEGDELARWEDALLRMPPADKSLDADGEARGEAEDRLVVKHELAAGQGPP